MKVYILYGEHGTYMFSEVLDICGYYLIPIPNTYEYTSYDKKLYSIKIVEAKKL